MRTMTIDKDFVYRTRLHYTRVNLLSRPHPHLSILFYLRVSEFLFLQVDCAHKNEMLGAPGTNERCALETYLIRTTVDLKRVGTRPRLLLLFLFGGFTSSRGALAVQSSFKFSSVCFTGGFSFISCITSSRVSQGLTSIPDRPSLLHTDIKSHENMTVCKFYNTPSGCKFGTSCKFEHPSLSTAGSFGGRSNSGFGIQGSRKSPSKINYDEIRKDLTETRPNWILTAYGPERELPASLFTDNEYSPEEIRVRFYEQQAANNADAADAEAIAAWTKAQNDMKDAASRPDEVVRFMESQEQQRPNRYDILKMDGKKSRDEYTREVQAGRVDLTSSSTTLKPAFGQSAPAFGRSPFGTANLGNQNANAPQQRPLFGQSAMSGRNAFASPAGQGSATSSFGQPAAPSAFGQTSNLGSAASSNPFSRPSAFGQSSGLGSGASSSPFSKPAAFGQPAASGGFGSTSQPAFGQSGFGGAVNTGVSSPFGQNLGAGNASSPFGQAAGGGSSNSPFGQAAGNTASSGFGQPAFGQPAKPSPFGQTAGGFGQANAGFGSTAFGGNTSTSGSPFGGSQATSSPFGVQQASSGTFGQAASSPFGGATNTSGLSAGARTGSNNPFGSTQNANSPFGGAQNLSSNNPFMQPAQQISETQMSIEPVQPQPPATIVAQPDSSKPTDKPIQPLHYTQTLPRIESRFDPVTGHVVQYRGLPVESISTMRPTASGEEVHEATNHYYHRPSDNKLERIWFPRGNAEQQVERLPQSKFDFQLSTDKYTQEIKDEYAYLFENGRFRDGKIPLIPPIREWVDYDI